MRGVAFVAAAVALAVFAAAAAAAEQTGAPAQSAQDLPTLDPTETVAMTEAVAEAAKVQTRAMLRDECPVTGVPAGAEEAIALTGLAMSLFSAVLPRAIDKGVELATNYARQKGSDQETLADPSVVRIEGFYALNQGAASLAIAGKCLVVGVGPVGKPVEKDFEPLWRRSPAIFEKVKQLGFSSTPHLYLESLVATSTDGSFFALQPKLFAFVKPLGGEGRGDERSIEFGFQFETPSGSDGGKPFALGTLRFANIPMRTVLEGDAIKGSTTAWLGLMPVSEPLRKVIEARIKAISEINAIEAQLSEPTSPEIVELRTQLAEAKKAQRAAVSSADDEMIRVTLDSKIETADDASEKAVEAAKRKIARRAAILTAKNDLSDQTEALNAINKKLALKVDLKTKKDSLVELDKAATLFQPANLVVKISEKAKGSPFFATVADVLSKAAPDVTDVLKQRLDPAKAAQLDLAAQQQDVELRTKALDAFQTAKLAELALAQLTPESTADQRLRAEIAALKAQIAANLAYARAGLEPPFKGLRMP
jgi:hypothetical protein